MKSDDAHRALKNKSSQCYVCLLLTMDFMMIHAAMHAGNITYYVIVAKDPCKYQLKNTFPALICKSQEVSDHFQFKKLLKNYVKGCMTRSKQTTTSPCT